LPCVVDLFSTLIFGPLLFIRHTRNITFIYGKGEIKDKMKFRTVALALGALAVGVKAQTTVA
jgi:hypothetical protein